MNAQKMKNEIMYLAEIHNGDLQYLLNLGLNLLSASFEMLYGEAAQDRFDKCIIEFLKDYAEIEESHVQ